MKRLFLFLMIALLALPVFAEGEGEVWADRVVTVAGGRGYGPDLEAMAAEKYPGTWIPTVRDAEGKIITEGYWETPPLTFRYLDIDQTTGENVTMTALVAAGTPPDIYVGFAGRAGQYLVPEYALPLTVDESVWDQAVLDTYKHDGGLYGLPFSLPVQGMAINTDVTDAAGYDIPEGAWDIYDYIEMLVAIKDSGQDIWPTFLYAGSPSADYFWLNWFSAFGIELFDEGKTRSTFNDTSAGEEVMEFLKYLVDNELSPKDSAIRTVNEVLPGFREAGIATTGFRPNWIPPHLKTAVEQGKIKEPFNYTVKPFPVKPGVTWPAPIPGVGTCVLAHITDNPDKAKILTDVVVFIAGIAQAPSSGDILTRYDVVKDEEADAVTQTIIDYTAEGGFMDPGYTYEWYAETREGALPILRELYNGQITPAEAADDYAEMVDEILAEYK